MRPVILSGFMGTGKSTAGPRVAERLGLPFVDTDAEIERAAGHRIAQMWERDGEAAFRVREADLVTKLLGDGVPRVIAVGGGTLANPVTRRLAIDTALVVTLTASLDSIARRMPDVKNRPNLHGKDPVERARELLDLRADAYAECHLTVCTDALDDRGVADAVIRLVRRDPLVVPLGIRSYTIDVCRDEPAHLTEAIARCGPTSVVVVTDSNVRTARGEALEASLGTLNVRRTDVILSPGEKNKTLSAVATIWDAALGAKADRNALIVAAGGGVVGDLAGFGAACLLRGIRFVQVPTSLLAMVDSSVGGKTGFDHAAGKNLIGAFHQPSGVVADVGHLVTLSGRERGAGLAEVVKIALATDPGLIEQLEALAIDLARGDLDAILPVVRAAVTAKIRVVRDDERESGPRALLNLGHTVGHALEAHGDFGGWLHGEAVALGTVVEMRATAALGWTPPDLVQRAAALFGSLGLPTHVEGSEIASAWSFVGSDKKRGGDHLALPVVTAAGESHVRRVPIAQLREAVMTSSVTA